MVEFKTKVYYENEDNDENPNIIGAEVTVYSEEGDNIGSIQITSKKDFDDLMAKLDVIDETYLLKSDLATEVAKINVDAKTLDGESKSYFAPLVHNHDTAYYSRTEMNNKLNWKSDVQVESTGAAILYYNDLECILEIKDLTIDVRQERENNQQWRKVREISIPSELCPNINASSPSFAGGQDCILTVMNKDSPGVQFRRIGAQFSNDKYTINSRVMWRRVK